MFAAFLSHSREMLGLYLKLAKHFQIIYYFLPIFLYVIQQTALLNSIRINKHIHKIDCERTT